MPKLFKNGDATNGTCPERIDPALLPLEVVARLERLLAEAGEPAVGWTDEEIRLLRSNTDCERYLPDAVPARGEDWQALWKGMPEFVQEDQSSHRKLVVHFRNEKDYLAFLKLVDHAPTETGYGRNSIWFPKAERGVYTDKRYRANEEAR